MRHIVNVMRPTEAKGTRGQTQGQPVEIVNQWPCEILPLSGREVEQARTVFAEASHKVTGYGNPNKLIRAVDELTGGDLGSRVLAIGYISDPSLHQIGKIELVCGERT